MARPFGAALPENGLKNTAQSVPPQPSGGGKPVPSVVTGVGAGPAHGSDDISSSYGPVMVRLPVFSQTAGFGRKKVAGRGDLLHINLVEIAVIRRRRQ